ARPQSTSSRQASLALALPIVLAPAPAPICYTPHPCDHHPRPSKLFVAMEDRHQTAADDDDDAMPPLVPFPGPVQAPRRCFICLTDESPADAPETWVEPCPCTLEAHQDCMLSWVINCERSNKPLLCPVCKSAIQLDYSWDPIVAATGAIWRRFNRASPLLLFTGVSLGLQCSLQMYGGLALWAFAGKDSLMRFILGPDMFLDATAGAHRSFVMDRIWKALAMMNVGPVLLFVKLFPGLSCRFFCPTASMYGMYQVMQDDNFLTWPPSPKLALTVFPYVQATYHYLWTRYAMPYETRLNRQLIGLPIVEADADRQEVGDRAQGAPHFNGGLMGLLHAFLEALEPEDEGREVNRLNELLRENDREQNQLEGEIVVRVQIGEGEADQELVEAAQLEAQADEGLGGFGDEDNDENNDNAGQERRGHEVPAPPPRAIGLGTVLSSVTNTIVGALILPGVSMVMGELLRLALPRTWTMSRSRNPWGRFGVVERAGLLQQQWGRSLIGGCLFVVLRDAARVYTKSRGVATLETRRANPQQQSSRQRLALAICHFLNTSISDGTLAADDKDSIDVAVSCIADTFKVDAGDEDAVRQAIGSQSLLQIYSVYEKLKGNNTTASSSSTTTTSSTSDASSTKPTEAQKKEGESLKSKGNAAMAQKDYASAIDLYTQALKLDPSNAVFLSNRAAAHSAAKDHDAARIDAEAAVAADPSYTKAWSRLGLARFALGDAKGAMDAYSSGIQHEGNGGSEAMRKGYETAKRRVEELESDDSAATRGQGPFSAGAGGLPDLGSIMSNPMFANMAQNLMSNPDLMSSLMSNPRLREMANSFGAGGGAGGGGMPDFSSLMSDPNIADMARNLMGGGGGPNNGPNRNNNNDNNNSQS
ncbi:hypothetical protein CP533_3594, partial [Ophiocordyceps camponoti-saundersi (nom. inval.)]